MAKYDSIEEIEAGTDGAGLSIGIVVTRFNADASDGLLASCTAALAKLGVSAADITIVNVPGALEVPLALQQMAGSEDYDALIALGAVIRGETYHFEIVANESARGIMQVQLDTGIPVANGILTTENDEQAESRMAQKGADMLHRSLTAFVNEDVETAKTLPIEDDEVDALYNQIYRELMTFIIQDPTTIERANWLLWVAHNLERFADRVTNICERTIFIATGEMAEIKSTDDEFWKNQRK